jgi:hypothetical protein
VATFLAFLPVSDFKIGLNAQLLAKMDNLSFPIVLMIITGLVEIS